MSAILYTIGHSNHEASDFLALLRRHGVTALADVRSHPYSRYVPQYSYNALKHLLVEAGMHYVFLGKELGARSENPACYVDGKVQYARLAQESIFQEGLRRVTQGMEHHVIALMCAEKDPLDCHRTLLVARHLAAQGVEIHHILADGAIETQAEAESRLLALCKLPEADLFMSREELIAEAYRIREQRIAYQDAGQTNEEEPDLHWS